MDAPVTNENTAAPSASTSRTFAAQGYDRAADELETAAKHLRQTAQHFRDGEVPRACAHTVAATGHLRRAERQMGELAEFHADRAQL